ncbi:MAG: response regulator, partial [Saprospiraceae bacterium]|nr:response regulator [Saprospiraceae bacterium]
VDRHESHLSGKIDWSISIIDSVLWLGGIDFITLHDMRSDWQPQPTYPVVINQVTYLEDSLLAAGPYHRTEHRISFEKNRFRFNYAAVQHRDNSLTNYQVRLAGHEDNWSNWTKETQIDYTNLGEGAYSFEVRARNTSNVIGQIARYNFSILPPWHRSWWAYIFYILTGIFGTGMIVRWRSAQLRREKLSLQKIVKERTSELQVRNEQLQAQKQQLAEQADRLQEVDELKSRFFANISHEFRTPLTLIKGPIDQAFKTPDTSLGRHTIKLIKKNADRLLQLVNQMLDLAKVDAGSLRVEPAEGNVFKGLRAAASSFSSMAAQRNLDYQIKIPARSLWTSFDRDKLDKVVYNLLSNAFKFTPDEGSIIFGASYIDEVLSFSVQDSGAGIDPGQLDRIFDRFFQVDSSETREQQGSGIGLALSKELIELMHGDIIVTSTPGKGSCFKVNIPMLEILGTRPKAIVHPDTPTIISDEVVNSPVANLASSIVLIVEDHEDMGNFIAEQLQEDFIINRASNGEVGFEQAVKAIPDLIITDLMMPKMDGIEMTRLLKMDERTSHIPIIMLTAKAGTDNLIRGIETGADNYLTKPFNADELQARVKNLIRQRTLLREHYAKSTVFNPKEIEVPSRDEVFLQKIQDLLELQHDDPSFGVPIMQKELALSKTQLHRKVKALTNRTPGELLRIFRIQRAMQLLTQSGENVSSVSYQVGFNDPSYFAKVFKDVQGVTPSQFVKDTISK